ncbi:MAG: hypothetical protein ACRDDX_02275 [Cellulosilyticaceae bacterium]
MGVTIGKPICNVKCIFAKENRMTTEPRECGWEQTRELNCHDSSVFEEAIGGYRNSQYWAISVATQHRECTYYQFLAEEVNLCTSNVIGYVLIKVYESPEGCIKLLSIQSARIRTHCYNYVEVCDTSCNQRYM